MVSLQAGAQLPGLWTKSITNIVTLQILMINDACFILQASCNQFLCLQIGEVGIDKQSHLSHTGIVSLEYIFDSGLVWTIPQKRDETRKYNVPTDSQARLRYAKSGVAESSFGGHARQVI